MNFVRAAIVGAGALLGLNTRDCDGREVQSIPGCLEDTATLHVKSLRLRYRFTIHIVPAARFA